MSVLAALKKPPKILVVDDKESERLMLSKILSRFNAEIISSSSGQEALSQLLRHDVNLVLLDIQMPIMNGIETAQLMRSNERTKNIPVIFLTAYDKDEISMLQGYKVGAIDYLFKPINREILDSKVQTFLRAYSFEKEKEYEIILTELEEKNKKLIQAQKETLQMIEEANRSRKQAEESKRQVEAQSTELLRYTRELEQFAYVATHDIRAPMINLTGLLQIFQRRGYVTPDNEEVVGRIFRSVERLNTTLNDLIQVVSARKSNSLPARKIFFEKIVSLILQDLDEEIQANKVAIETLFEVEAIYYIHYQLRSILLNLIVNAIRYSDRKKSPWIRITTSKENGYIRLKVEDNGIGIGEHQEDKVFGLFQRLNTEKKGKGMGLYIIKSQIESMGGRISYQSEVGKGTTFTVDLKAINNADKT